MSKFLIYGNNLNQGYFLACHLEKLGHTAKVCVNISGAKQDLPEWWIDDHDIDRSKLYIIESKINLTEKSQLIDQKTIKSLYSEARIYDYIIIREDGPAVFSEFYDRPLIFVSQGADLQVLPWLVSQKCSILGLFYCFMNKVHVSYQISYSRKIFTAIRAVISELRNFPYNLRFQNRQRLGILRSHAAIIFPYQTYLAEKIGLKKNKIHYAPIPYSGSAVSADSRSYENSIEIQRFKSRFDYLFFHPTRFFYRKVDASPYKKDNLKLLNAFRDFTLSSNKNCGLILVEKGEEYDINWVKSYIKKNNIEDFVFWLPDSPQATLREIYCDEKTITFDQFSPYVNTLGNIGRETVECGCPLVTSYDGADDIMYTSPPPNIKHANSVETIIAAMEYFTSVEKSYRFDLKRRCKIWHQENLDSEKNTIKYLEIIKSYVDRE